MWIHPVHIVDSLYSEIKKRILDSHETRQPHITNCDVRAAIKDLRIQITFIHQYKHVDQHLNKLRSIKCT